MLSRKKIESMIYCGFDFNALPSDIQDMAKEFASTIPLEILDKLSDKIKFVLKSDFFHLIEHLPSRNVKGGYARSSLRPPLTPLIKALRMRFVNVHDIDNELTFYHNYK